METLQRAKVENRIRIASRKGGAGSDEKTSNWNPGI